MKVGIIGGGPSGFYVASRLLSLLRHKNLSVHVYDRLWAPHGLVRYGVAPDHPEVKNCTHKFDQTAQDPRFRFFGNINIDAPTFPGALSVPLSTLQSHYTHLVFATGCSQPNLHAALPPSSRVVPALSLVHWYTSHPLAYQASPPSLSDTEHVSLIGNGNVALDIARMLLTPVDKLRGFDVPEHVLQTLSESTVKHVSVYARRGPLNAAFTTKELREMMDIPGCSMAPLDSDLLTFSSDITLTRQQSRIMQLLKSGSKEKYGSTGRSFSLDFFRSPVGITEPETNQGKAQLSLAHTVVDPATQRAVPSSQVSIVETDLVVPALGFHASPATPFFDPGLNHLRNVSGRIISSDGQYVPNTYASGWAGMGAQGVLAKTMMNAYSVADTILGDLSEQYPEVSESLSKTAEPLDGQVHDDIPPVVLEGIKSSQVTTYDTWRRIDAEERRRGQDLGKERERMNTEDAFAFIRSS